MIPEDTGLTQKAEMVKCPSCHKSMALPAFTDLSKLQRCPLCGAMSKGIKWLTNNKLQRGLHK